MYVEKSNYMADVSVLHKIAGREETAVLGNPQ
jgi:hypothetical protein